MEQGLFLALYAASPKMTLIFVLYKNTSVVLHFQMLVHLLKEHPSLTPLKINFLRKYVH